MDHAVMALQAEQRELTSGLEDLDAAGWSRPTRCEGWDVADVVLHLAQTNELAIGSATDSYESVLASLAQGLGPASSVDEGAAAMVDKERGLAPDELMARWEAGCERLIEVLDVHDLSRRVRWVAGELSLRTLAATRVAETWIHAGDVAAAVGRAQVPSDRLLLIARLAWRTLPYAFASAGQRLSGPVAFRLSSPAGEPWDFVPDQPAVTTVTGPAVDLCRVAARRVDPARTLLSASGADADWVLALVRTYA